MKRRLLAGLLGFVFAASSALAVERFVEGEHYERLPVAVQPANADKVEVVEVFSYACIHCFSFDPMLEGWVSAMPEDVSFERLPAIFSQDWATLAQLYYTAEALDVLDKVHSPIFNGIHMERRDLRDPNLAASLFEEAADVTPEQFTEVSNSFSVRSRVQQANARTRAYRVTGVPSLIVAGKYRVSGSMAGSNGKMLEVVDFLIEKERGSQVQNDE